MPTSSTYQTTGMLEFDGRAAGIDGNGFIVDIAEKRKVSVKSASYTVKLNESGTWFVSYGATAAVVFTLPAVASSDGCVYRFYNASDVSMGIASAEGDNVVAKNELAADTVTFQTTSELIGGCIEVFSDGTLWYVCHMAEELVTVTVAG